MAKEGIWHDVPPPVKGIIYLVATGLSVWGIYEGVQYIREHKKEKGGREEVKDIKKELNDLNKNPGTRQTLSPSGAAAISNNLFTAMDGYGTDSVAVAKNLLKLKNQADWLAVRKAFGTKTISSGKLNPTPDFTGTLEAALTDEIGTVDSTITPSLNQYFKARGIDLSI